MPGVSWIAVGYDQCIRLIDKTRQDGWIREPVCTDPVDIGIPHTGQEQSRDTPRHLALRRELPTESAR